MDGNSGKTVAFTAAEIKRYGSHGMAKIVLGDRTGNRTDVMPGMYFANIAPLMEQGGVKRMWVSERNGKVAFCASSGKQEAGNGIRKRVEIVPGRTLEPLVEIMYMSKHNGDDSGFDIRARYTSGETVTSVRMPIEAAVTADIL